jgi:hypothetical protein
MALYGVGQHRYGLRKAFTAAFSERRGKSFVRKQPAEKIIMVLAPRSENAAGKRDSEFRPLPSYPGVLPGVKQIFASFHFEKLKLLHGLTHVWYYVIRHNHVQYLVRRWLH